MSGFPQNNAADLLFDRPISGSWLASAGTNPTPGTMLTAATVQGAHIFVPNACTVNSFGLNITGAGDASSIAFLSLFQRIPGTNQYQIIIPEQQLNVAAAIGIQQVTGLNFPLSPGNYIALERMTSAGVFPTIQSISGPAGLPGITPMDLTEAFSDFNRGGIHPGSISGYISGAPPNLFTLVTNTRSVAPRLLLGV